MPSKKCNRFLPYFRWPTLLLLLLLLSCFSCVQLCVTPRWQPTRLPRPWNSPGKNTGVGCHFFLQCMKVKSEREVAQLCPTLRDPMDCSLPGSSVHGIFQARVLEWGATAFSCLRFMQRGKNAGWCEDQKTQISYQMHLRSYEHNTQQILIIQ